jgi:flagellar hook-associated protein 2
MAATSSISGIVSGLDTSSIIDSLMALERRPAVLLEQDQSEKTNIVSALKALQAKLVALASDVSVLTRRASFETASVNVSDDTYLSATSSGKGVAGSYDIQILALARNHQIASQGFADQSSALLGTGTITLSTGSGSAKTITIDASNNSLTGLKNAINDAGAGVKATIISDGSSTASYRLILAADKPGAANAIKVSANLTGGQTLNYTTPTFDAPEWVSKNSSSTSLISLGGTAAFAGTTNKIYSFTVEGTGTKTIGTDNVTINWTDGTNSGSIVVSQADAEVDLAVPGAQGLKLNFSSGMLVGGDQFQVQTFAPLLQSASDARVAVGTAGGAGSPIIVTSSTNTLSGAIPGVNLTLKKTTIPGEPITVTTDIDLSAIKEKIGAFIKSYNDVKDYIDKQNRYDKETTESGVLFGDSTLFTMQNTLSRAVSSSVAGLQSKYKQLATIGIRTGLDGKLVFREPAKLEEALRADSDILIKLLGSAGSSTSNKIEFVSSTEKTKAGTNYAVNITSAATKGRFQATNIANPGSIPLILTSNNSSLKLVVNSTESDYLVLEAKTYGSTAELVEEIQSKIDADAKIGSLGLAVSWVPSSDTLGHLEFTSSIYGSSSKVNLATGVGNSAFATLGMTTGQSEAGLDVQGTINGEKAEGSGQVLTGKAGNKTTEGLKLRVTLGTFDVNSGDDGAVTITKGVASRLAESLDSLTKSTDGFVDRRISSYQKQIDSLKERVKQFDALLVLRKESLVKKFSAMESALGQLNATNTFLTNAISGLNANYINSK